MQYLDGNAHSDALCAGWLYGIVVSESCFLRGGPGRAGLQEPGREERSAPACLPEADGGGKVSSPAETPSIPMRFARDGASAEWSGGIEDEIFSGWAVRFFPETEENGWVKIETHYGYMGYVKKSQFVQVSREELVRRQDQNRFFRIGVPVADLSDQPRVQGLPLECLPKNAIVERMNPPENLSSQPEEATDGSSSGGDVGSSFPGDDADSSSLGGDTDGWCLVRTAAGHVGYVHEKYLRPRLDDDGYLLQEKSAAAYFREKFLADTPPEAQLREGVVQSARSYLGVQYRWGGKSSMGLDCSGLAFMSYLENGVLIYRDARIVPGYPIAEIPREQIKPGDLIFFPGHVAVYLGGGRYIHSTGYKETPYVTINSLNPKDEDYRGDLAGKISACGSVYPPQRGADCAGEHPRYAAPVQADKKEARKFEKLRERLDKIPGSVSAVYKDLNTGESFTYRAEEQHNAASVIKLFLMAAVYQGFADGIFSPEDRLRIRRQDCVPSCGVLTYLQGEREVSVRDLVELMIIVSDNTAANVLFDLVGEERLAGFLREKLGLKKTVFCRKMFDEKRAALGIENYVTAEDAAWLLERIYRGELISPQASRAMYQILTHQRLNGKIPFYLHALPEAPVIAHKTGEDSRITHDVAIIEGKSPFILCFLGSGTDVPGYERLMAEAALELYMES